MGVRCAYKFSADGCVRAVAGAVVTGEIMVGPGRRCQPCGELCCLCQ